MFIFVLKFVRFLCPAPSENGAGSFRLDHFNVDFVSAGAAFYLDRHVSSLSLFIFSLRHEVLHSEHADCEQVRLGWL